MYKTELNFNILGFNNIQFCQEEDPYRTNIESDVCGFSEDGAIFWNLSPILGTTCINMYGYVSDVAWNRHRLSCWLISAPSNHTPEYLGSGKGCTTKPGKKSSIYYLGSQTYTKNKSIFCIFTFNNILISPLWQLGQLQW